MLCVALCGCLKRFVIPMRAAAVNTNIYIVAAHPIQSNAGCNTHSTLIIILGISSELVCIFSLVNSRARLVCCDLIKYLSLQLYWKREQTAVVISNMEKYCWVVEK
jgi:hypothetical protein